MNSDEKKWQIEQEMRESIQEGGLSSPEGLARRLTAHLDSLNIEDRRVAISILVSAGVADKVPWPPEESR
jgi:hypothetical protein